MIPLDPFTTVTQQLISILRDSVAMTGPYGIGVKPANIINLTQGQKAQDDPVAAPQAGTAPQILVLPSRGVFRPYGNASRAAECERTWLLCITTDTLRLGGENSQGAVTLFSTEWAMLLAFVGQNPNLGLPGLVRTYKPMMAQERGLLDEFPALARGTKRWTAVIALDVTLYWGSAALGAYIASITPS